MLVSCGGHLPSQLQHHHLAAAAAAAAATAVAEAIRRPQPPLLSLFSLPRSPLKVRSGFFP